MSLWWALLGYLPCWAALALWMAQALSPELASAGQQGPWPDPKMDTDKQRTAGVVGVGGGGNQTTSRRKSGCIQEGFLELALLVQALLGKRPCRGLVSRSKSVPEVITGHPEPDLRETGVVCTVSLKLFAVGFRAFLFVFFFLVT